jgi:hypothetical protein
LFIIQFFLLLFLLGGGSVCPGEYAGLSQGWLWEYCMTLICSPVGLLDVSQAGLEPASGDTGALLFSQCKVVWRSFVQAGAFFLPSVAAVSQQDFLFMELMLSASTL